MTFTLYLCPWHKQWSYYIRDEKNRLIQVGGFHKSEAHARRAAQRTLQKASRSRCEITRGIST